ncbi:putative translation initiation inhibitor, yjgF family [Shewanella psychrophila]|uniref:Putative translation initiation inhibitor, yjgF family n=1 Tax=Shewanella psychrophila TaxID=225848 RepID=A0A1S6HWE2_9GAMM|nr:RidA family protein [Shewanella psychrophila]AQS39896.1 putative translation initiation inhibitor, yjgF family [Shewanella psychrophila]
MNKIWSPDNIAPPAARYHHCAHVPANCSWLHIAGQLGIDLDGQLGEGIEQQVLYAWQNIEGVLQANQMSREDIVSVRVYLTDREDLSGYRAAMQQLFNGHSQVLPVTLLFVAGLFSEDWKVEIEVQAAKS